MRTTYMAAAAIVCLVVLSTGSGASKETDGREILKKWDGHWTHHTVVRPAAWSLVGTELSGTSTSRWILNDHYQQVTGRSGGNETREIHRFDANSGQFHKWVFDSDGGHSFWIGAWNAKSETMAWKYVDFGLGVEGKIVNRFSDDGGYETTLYLKDSKSNVLLDIRSQHTRIAAPTE